MPYRNRGRVLALVQILARVIPDRLQLPVACPAFQLVEHHQRFLDERRHEIEHVLRREWLGAADRLGRLEVEAAGKDAQTFQQPLLGLQ